MHAVIDDRRLDPAVIAKMASDESTGASVTFCGVVRDHDEGRGVRTLEYVAHPTASRRIVEIAERVSSAHPSLTGLVVAHRIGLLSVGDIALVVVAASAHRQAAFEACAELVEEVKRAVPVWKRHVFDDGTAEWVNSA